MMGARQSSESGSSDNITLADRNLATLPVSSEADARVRRLDASRNRLQELQVPDLSTRLPNLMHLDLSFNYLLKFPECVLEMPLLERLDLSCNCIATLPESLPRARSLMSLFVGDNHLRTLPRCLLDMPQLASVFLPGNFLSLSVVDPRLRGLLHGLELQRVPTPIRERLYLGSSRAAEDQREMNARGITHVLIASKSLEPRFPDVFCCERLLLDDHASQGLDLEQAAGRIGEVLREGGTLLVHCSQGVSRSASLVVAYLMASERLSFAEALGDVASRRFCVDPNPGFREQLGAFEGACAPSRPRGREGSGERGRTEGDPEEPADDSAPRAASGCPSGRPLRCWARTSGPSCAPVVRPPELCRDEPGVTVLPHAGP